MALSSFSIRFRCTKKSEASFSITVFLGQHYKVEDPVTVAQQGRWWEGWKRSDAKLQMTPANGRCHSSIISCGGLPDIGRSNEVSIVRDVAQHRFLPEALSKAPEPTAHYSF